jgi:uncharacterized protein with LGFP repeats
VLGGIRTRWAAQGWERGGLGYPVSDERCGLSGGGCFQRFQGGSVYWAPGLGAHAVRGALRDRWGALAWERGRLGYPVAGEVCGLRDGGCFQPFQGGAVYWSPHTGAHAVFGVIRDRWASRGWEAGQYGYPVQDPVCDTSSQASTYGNPDGSCTQWFQGGVIDTFWDPWTWG